MGAAVTRPKVGVPLFPPGSRPSSSTICACPDAADPLIRHKASSQKPAMHRLPPVTPVPKIQ
jgi:hypothetical protein